MSSGRHAQVSSTCLALASSRRSSVSSASVSRRAGARLLRRPRCLSVARACLGSGRDVRRCRPDRRRANCDAESVQQRWPRDIGASGERADVGRGGPRCFRRYRAPRSGAPTSWPTSEGLSFCEPPHGGLQAGRRGANACPRLASSGSFVSRPVSSPGERKRHGEQCDSEALAWCPLEKRLARTLTSQPVPFPNLADCGFRGAFCADRAPATTRTGYAIPRT
jgi:hypothetical protein